MWGDCGAFSPLVTRNLDPLGPFWLLDTSTKSTETLTKLKSNALLITIKILMIIVTDVWLINYDYDSYSQYLFLQSYYCKMNKATSVLPLYQALTWIYIAAQLPCFSGSSCGCPESQFVYLMESLADHL